MRVNFARSCFRILLATLFTVPRWIGVHVADATAVPGDFQLGVLGPFTSFSQGWLGVIAAFDIDLRKNFEPELQARFGPPIVQVPNINPALQQLQLRLATSHSQGAVAIDAVLQWIASEDGAPLALRGFVGEFFSSISGPVASVAGTRSLPQVSWASTSPTLSNKGTYPFFSRTVSSDSFQGAALWTWVQQFDVPAVAFVYTSEAYGEGLFQVVLGQAAEEGRTDRVYGIPIAPRDLNASRRAVQSVRETGTKFVMLAPADSGNYFLYAMEEAGLLYSTFQFVVTEAVTVSVDTWPRVSGGWPAGLHRFTPVSTGPLFSNFTELWHRLTPDDIYSTEALQRYGLDNLAVPLEDALVPKLVAEDFADISSLESSPLANFIFDALYTFAFAFNSLLNSGYPVEDLRGQLLLDAVRATEFEGITGVVGFDANGDRLARFDLQTAFFEETLNETRMRRVGSFNEGVLTFDVEPTWAPDGDQGVAPPDVLFQCTFGFERETTTNLCLPCAPGVGCGFQDDDGIPLGVAFPMTSITQEFLAIVLTFYKDLQRNINPTELGEPVVKLPNVHPDLKLKLQVGTSHSTVSIGMNTALDWFLGSGDFSKVAGIVFGFHSNIAVPVASIAAGFEIPMVGFASTSPTLSDKGQYPYFLRTVAPDSLQGSAMWRWARWFRVPTVAFFYTQDAYGEGLFQVVNQLAALDGLADSLRGVSIRAHVGDPDLNALREACSFIKQLGSPFIMVGMIYDQATPALYVMEQENMLYGEEAYQILGTEAVYIHEQSLYIPSRGLPVGFQKFLPGTQGPLYPRYLELWRNLTVEELYSVDTRKRFMLEYLRVPLADAVSPRVTQAALDSQPFPPFLLPLLFDALYTYAVAINNLLNSGVEARDVYGPVLFEELSRTSFEGISGKVSFNSDGDRFAIYEMYNYQPAGGGGVSEVLVGHFDAALSSFVPLGGEAGEPLELVWARGLRGTSAPNGLLECAPGTAYDTSLNRCTRCPSGFVSQGGLNAECRACPPGSTSSADAQECELCPGGTFAELGGKNCTNCPAGSFAGVNGSSACELCYIGTYSSSAGATECTQCGLGRSSQEHFTTMTRLESQGLTQYQYVVGSDTSSFCGCDVGRRQDEAGDCLVCTEGMFCPGLDSIFVEYGYYSAALPDLSIYKCWGDEERCVGGPPGETCAPGRRSITCSECEDNKTPESGGGCVVCSGADKAPFYLVMLTVLVVLVLLYVMTTTKHGKNQSLSLVLCAVASGQLVTMMQQVGVVGSLSLQWEEPLKSLIRAASVLALDIKVLRLNCVGTVKPRDRYILKLVMLLGSTLVLGITHHIVVLFFHKGKFRKHRWSLVAAVSALLLVFYITVAGIVLEPLQCKAHPNDKWTLWHYQSIVCWESGEHLGMLVIGFVVFLFVPVGFLVGVVAAVQQFPARMRRADAKFVRAFAFLFFRFKPGKQWFLTFHLGKSLLLACCLVIPDILLETVALQVILLVGFAVSLVVKPWRVKQGNWLDAFLGAAVLVLVIFASFYVEDKDKNLSILSWLSFVILTSGLVLIGLLVFYGLWRKYVRQDKPFAFFLCHHKAASGAYSRLLKMHLLDLPRLHGDVFIDSDNLDNLDHLFDYVRSDTRTLVIVATNDIFTRPWCVGEMTTARIKQVFTLLLATPTYKLPDEQLIASLANHGIPNVEVLIENGMDLQMIEETFMWVSTLPAIHVPKVISRMVMTRVAEKVHTSKADSSLMSSSDSLITRIDVVTTSGIVETKHCFLMYDTQNMEACACCYVLQKMLAPLMGHDTDLVPEVVDHAEDLPVQAGKYSALLMLCTNGACTNPICLRMLVRMQAGSFVTIPVLADTGFRFPPQDAVAWLESWNLPDFDSDTLTLASTGLASVFKEIAAHFEPSHASIVVLEVSARQLQQRILRHRQAFRRGAVGAGGGSNAPEAFPGEEVASRSGSLPGLPGAGGGSFQNLSNLARRGLRIGGLVASKLPGSSSDQWTPEGSSGITPMGFQPSDRVTQEPSTRSVRSQDGTVSNGNSQKYLNGSAPPKERLPPIAQVDSRQSQNSDRQSFDVQPPEDGAATLGSPVHVVPSNAYVSLDI